MIWITILVNLLAVLLQWLLNRHGRPCDPNDWMTGRVNLALLRMRRCSQAALLMGYSPDRAPTENSVNGSCWFRTFTVTVGVLAIGFWLFVGFCIGMYVQAKT